MLCLIVIFSSRRRHTRCALVTGVQTCSSDLLRQAESHAAVIMPGYTHLQPAQPITFGWFLLGILHALERDHRRFAEIYPRTNLNPLDAGAVPGTSLPIHRADTQRLLGLDALARAVVRRVWKDCVSPCESSFASLILIK